MPAPIFISYRRSDTAGHAGRLLDRLLQWWDKEVVFFDTHTIEAGEAFPDVLEQAVDAARLMLVVIGPAWEGEFAEREQRSDVDWVRREVARALARLAAGQALTVLPVLMNRADPPAVAVLPAELQRLAPLHVHAFGSGYADWQAQFEQLRLRIQKLSGIPAGHYRPAAGKPKPFGLGDLQPAPHFHDPEDKLGQLRATLTEHGRAAVIANRATLHGMGGIGKTQLALNYCYAFRHAYDGIWWFSAEADAQLQLNALTCATALGLPAVEGELPALTLRRGLEHAAGQWLLVYDNAEAPEAVRRYLPACGAHHVLVTSRDADWSGLATPFGLAVWTDAQGADYLDKRRPGEPAAERRALSADLGGLPLALDQAASYCNQARVSYAVYRQRFAADRAGKLLERGKLVTGYERTVAGTLALAHERLSPAARELLALCAWAAAPEPLPERFFLAAAEHLPPALAAAAADRLDWDDVVGELLRYALATREEGAPTAAETVAVGPALTLHRLTQQVARLRLVGGETAAGGLLAVLRAVCPADVEHPQHWPVLAALAPHAQALETFDRAQALALDRRALLWLLDRVVSYYHHGPALYATARALCERALELARQAFGADDPDTLTAILNLAGTLGQQGDLSGARGLGEQVLEARRRMLGEAHPDTLTAMGNLALTLGQQGDLSGARGLEEQVLEARRRVLGEAHPDTLTAMNNLASTLYQQGDLGGARGLQEQVLEASRRVHGEAHPDTLRAMGNLALTLGEQGDLSGARGLEEQGLEASRRVLGEAHPDTLRAMGNLALTLGEQGDLSGARGLEEQVLEARRRVLGEAHPDTLTAMGNLASTLYQQGDLSGARGLEEQGLEARRRVLGEAHPDTLTAMAHLADTAFKLGELDHAQDLQQQVLAGRRATHEEDHPYTLWAMDALAHTLRDQGRLDEARALAGQALAGCRALFGDGHRHTHTLSINLGRILRLQGDVHEARALQEKALSGYRDELGEQDWFTLRARHHLAQTLDALGHHAEALPLMQAAFDGLNTLFGPEHHHTKDSATALAAMLAARPPDPAGKIP